MTFAAAICYDWLYDAMTDAERETVYRAILKKGLTDLEGTPLVKRGLVMDKGGHIALLIQEILLFQTLQNPAGIPWLQPP